MENEASFQGKVDGHSHRTGVGSLGKHLSIHTAPVANRAPVVCSCDLVGGWLTTYLYLLQKRNVSEIRGGVLPPLRQETFVYFGVTIFLCDGRGAAYVRLERDARIGRYSTNRLAWVHVAKIIK